MTDLNQFEVETLGRYNAERSRGIVHTYDWDLRMGRLQAIHDAGTRWTTRYWCGTEHCPRHRLLPYMCGHAFCPPPTPEGITARCPDCKAVWRAGTMLGGEQDGIGRWTYPPEET